MTEQELLELTPIETAFRRVAYLIGNFLNLQKACGISIEQVERIAMRKSQGEESLIASIVKRALGFDDYFKSRLSAFFRIYRPVWLAYHAKISESGEIDFNDMISQAEEHVRSGRYKPSWKYILVDEFQDISPARLAFVQAILKASKSCVLFAVGDDWQSIYRFTGADISCTTQFGERFGIFSRTDLDMTFRFNDRISNAAARFITQNESQIKKEIKANKTEERRMLILSLYNPASEIMQSSLA